MSATLEHDLSHHDNSPEARRAALRDLTTGEVQVRPSSYVGTQNEVQGMLRAMEESSWPGPIYELAQGGLDFKKRSSQILLFVGDQVISFEDYINIKDVAKLPEITRIVFQNDFQVEEDHGLRPSAIYLTSHEGRDEGTLGVHGRGTKIAATAVLEGRHASRVTFSSYADGVGAWYGEATLVGNEKDKKEAPSLHLRYKTDETLTQDTTEITLHDPSPTLREALYLLPDWLLQANPLYENARFTFSEDNKIPNTFTAYTQPQYSLQEGEVSISRYIDGTQNMGAERSRVEIIPPQVVGEHRTHEVDYVFIDGLRVALHGETFSQVYAFWGFNHAMTGYNPRRSNDSLTIYDTAAARNVLGLVFENCPNPDVFATVLQALHQSEGNVYEGLIPSWVFHASSMSQVARTALTEAYRRTTQGQQVAITASIEAYKRATKENIPAINLGSNTWVNVLKGVSPDIQIVDDIFAKQQAQLEQKLREEQAQAAIREKAAAEEGVRKYLAERGVDVTLAGTGEVMKIPAAENPAHAYELAKLHILSALAQNEGRVLQLENGNLRFNMQADGFMTPPTLATDLGPITEFAKQLIAGSSGEIKLEATVIIDQKGQIFALSGSPERDEHGNLTMNIQAAPASLAFRSLLRVDCLFPDTIPAETVRFQHDLLRDIQVLTGEHGYVSQEKYLQSEFYENYPPAAELLRVRALLDQNKHEVRQALRQMNEQRAKAKLPLLPDPFAKEEEITARRRERRPSLQAVGGVSYDDRVRDDVPLNMLGPMSGAGLSRYGQATRREGGQSQEQERRVVPPHMYLTRGFGKVEDYLLMHPQPEFSNTKLEEYIPLPPLSHESMTDHPTLFFTHAIAKGLSSLPVPPGYRPVSLHRDGKAVGIQIAESIHGFFTMYSEEIIPAGLTIHFEPQAGKDHSLPTDSETRVMAIFEDLYPHWQNLILALNKSETTPKQKVDILLRAWTKAFLYTKAQNVFDFYEDVREDPLELNTMIINASAGDCGYADHGFYSLASLIGVPIRPVVSFLSDGSGQFRRDTNLHGITQVYLNGHWVSVEPQRNYIEEGYTVQPIPNSLKKEIEPLLAAIPHARKKTEIHEQGQENVRVVRETLPPEIASQLDAIQAIRPLFRAEELTEFNTKLQEATQPSTVVQEVPSSEEFTEPYPRPSTLEGTKPPSQVIDIEQTVQTPDKKQGFTRTQIKAAAGILGATILAEIATILTHQREIAETADEVREYGDSILQRLSHLPPTLVAPLLILLTGMAYRAGYNRGRNNQK
jgi:hypothetical protein